MCYHLDDDEIQLLLALFDSLRSQAATSTTLTSSLELLNLRLRLSLSSGSDSCCSSCSNDLVPPTKDNTFVQPVSLNFYHCKIDSNLHIDTM